MTEPNPYDPPQSPVPLTRTQIVKRGLGVTLIILLTPPAMVVTVLGCCSVASRMTDPSRGAVALLLPLVVLTGLMFWAMHLDRPQAGNPNRRPSRAGIFLVTPAVVAAGIVLGFVLAAVVVLMAGSIGGLPLYELAMQNSIYVFWLPPAAALLVMLGIAWRSPRDNPPVGSRDAPMRGDH